MKNCRACEVPAQVCRRQKRFNTLGSASEFLAHCLNTCAPEEIIRTDPRISKMAIKEPIDDRPPEDPSAAIHHWKRHFDDHTMEGTRRTPS